MIISKGNFITFYINNILSKFFYEILLYSQCSFPDDKHKTTKHHHFLLVLPIYYILVNLHHISYIFGLDILQFLFPLYYEY